MKGNTFSVLDFHAKQDYSLFMQWFVDAWKSQGAAIRNGISFPTKVRAVLSRLLCFNLSNRSGRIIVCGSHRIETMSWPFNLLYDVVPMMWDLWPGNYDAFERYVMRNRVRLVFCTARQSVAAMQSRCPKTRFVWVPEAVDVNAYTDGGPLAKRPVDVLSYGRSIGSLADDIARLAVECGWCFQRGISSWDFKDLRHDIAMAKISICYPNCDTNPKKCGGVETLTIRYWEAMLSGTLIVGRAPQELIDVCGYDPVIEAGDDPINTLRNVLKNLESYQPLAVRNRSVALVKGSWFDRLEIIKREVCGA